MIGALLRSWRAVSAGVLLGVVIGGAGAIVWVNSGPNIISNYVEETDGIISPAKHTIAFYTSGNRRKSCPTIVARYLWHWIDHNGKQVRYFQAIDNPPLEPAPELGPFAYVLGLKVDPSDFSPGQWWERTVSQGPCGWFGQQTIMQSADRPVTVRAQ
jgi:hypothetical protein